MPSHFAQGFKLAVALLAPIVTTLVFRARALATARAHSRAQSRERTHEHARGASS